MKIALFASAFHPHLGGVEELCKQLALELRRVDIGVVALTNRWPRSLPARETIEGIQVVRLPFRFPDGSFKSLLNYHLTHRSISRELNGILRQHRIDLLHVQCVNASTAYAVDASRQLKLPLVVTTQGERTMDATQLYQRSARMITVFRNALEAASAITACSIDTLQDVRRYFELPDEAGQVIYNGVRVADFACPAKKLPEERPYVLAIGRHVWQKGFDVLLKAWSKAQIESHDLVLAGDGPEHLNLKKMAGQLNIANQIKFFGPANRGSAIELFCNCCFFVLPSRLEPLGIVNLEAMAAGKAVIATRTGGVPELVEDGATGVLVPPDDVDALAAALTGLAGDSARCSKLGSAGRTKATAFDWPIIAEKYISIYRTAVGEVAA